MADSYAIAEPRTSRIDAVDWLRGLVMVIMALDHTRDFFTLLPPGVNPENPFKAQPDLFFTRWITHFCAPTFALLAGAGAFLYGARGRSRGELAWFLLSRGLWLIVLELTWVRWAALFNIDYHFSFVQVIWAIGASMVLLSPGVFLPTGVVAAIGLVIVCGHNWVAVHPEYQFGPPLLWDVLQVQRPFVIAPGYSVFNVYPLLAWIGVLFTGYGFGWILNLDRARRRPIVLAIGITMTLAFIVLRALHLYGDPRPWAPQPDPMRNVMAFLACSKYPPSLQFLLMTLGPALTLLALVDGPSGPPLRLFVTFGRVPLFFYLLHFPLIHASALGLAYLRFGSVDWLQAIPGPNAPTPPDGASLELRQVYVVWILIVLALYWPCLWWGRLKRGHPGGVLSYL
jgi:uncharacterized membrane protein